MISLTRFIMNHVCSKYSGMSACMHRSMSVGKSQLLSQTTSSHLKCNHMHTSSINFEKHPRKTKDLNSGDFESITSAVGGKYKIFRDEDASTIIDIEEERNLKAFGVGLQENSQQVEDEYSGLNLKRGVQGVFDIEELVDLLKRDKAQDTFVAKLPPELNYVDFIVVITGKSQRHMLAIAEFVRKVFKRKMNHKDIIPRIEGENSRDWIALDLGNIALHIFSKTARHVYDLDSLWAVGSEHDDQCNKPDDPLITLLQRHAIYLGDLQPNETHG